MSDKVANGKYRVIDVAKYVVSKCTRDNRLVTLNELQFILACIQKEYSAAGIVFFEDGVQEISDPPVFKEVARHYSGYADKGYGEPRIGMVYMTCLTDADRKVCDSIIEWARESEDVRTKKKLYVSKISKGAAKKASRNTETSPVSAEKPGVAKVTKAAEISTKTAGETVQKANNSVKKAAKIPAEGKTKTASKTAISSAVKTATKATEKSTEKATENVAKKSTTNGAKKDTSSKKTTKQTNASAEDKANPSSKTPAKTDKTGTVKKTTAKVKPDARKKTIESRPSEAFGKKTRRDSRMIPGQLDFFSLLL